MLCLTCAGVSDGLASSMSAAIAAASAGRRVSGSVKRILKIPKLPHVRLHAVDRVAGQ